MPFVQAGEIRLHYIEHGSGPEPVVFIHGYSSSTNNWVETLPRLPERYRAIALDLRGAGESDKPDGAYGPAIYARDIDLATRALGIDTFNFVGHSMGGLTGMQFALDFPQRLRKLILVAPAPSGGITLDPAIRAQVKAFRFNRELRRQFTKMLLTRPLSDELIDLSIDDDLKWPESSYEAAWQAMVDVRLSEAISSITTPALMVAGDRDLLRPVNLEDAGRIPNCALHVFYRTGHLVPFDVPDAFVELIDDFIQHGGAPPNPFAQRGTTGAAATSAGSRVATVAPVATAPSAPGPTGAGGASSGAPPAATAEAASDRPPADSMATAQAAAEQPHPATAKPEAAAPDSPATSNAPHSGAVPPADQRERELLARVRELACGPFTARAAGTDRDGVFPHENVADLTRLGLAGIGVPEELGGLTLSAETQMRIMEEIAYGDGSTAVALNMHRIAAGILAVVPPLPFRNRVLEDVGRQGALLCAPGSIPTGDLDNRTSGYQAVERGNDLVISGKAGFASMSDGATYLFCGGLIDRGGTADGSARDPDLFITVPRTDAGGVNILHNWDAMGLRGTASHDIMIDGLVVPKSDALVVPLQMFRTLLNAAEAQGGVMFQRRSLGTLGILAIWLGLAQAAYDFTVEYVAKRHGYLAGATSALGNPPGFRSEQAWAQTAIGNMEHWLETGRTVYYDMVRAVDQPDQPSQLFTRRLVRTVYHLRRMTEEVGMGAMKTCGAHAYVKGRPLERIFRDMMGGVVMAWKTDELVQTLGRGALGMPISIVGPAGS